MSPTPLSWLLSSPEPTSPQRPGADILAVLPEQARVDLGSDISTHPDLDETFALMTGPRVVAEAIWRRLQTQRGALSFHPDYGTDLRGYLHGPMSDQRLFSLRSDVEAECEKDPRVHSVDVSASFDRSTRALRVDIRPELADGPFSMVLKVSELTVDLLSVTNQ